jgi:hypothetical protein
MPDEVTANRPALGPRTFNPFVVDNRDRDPAP